jgi:hypothetical protein
VFSYSKYTCLTGVFCGIVDVDYKGIVSLLGLAGKDCRELSKGLSYVYEIILKPYAYSSLLIFRYLLSQVLKYF